MNVKYTYNQKNALVIDDNEFLSVKKVTDKLEEILIAENKVEIMENLLFDIKNEIPKLKIKKFNNTEWAILSPIIGTFGFAVFGFSTLYTLIGMGITGFLFGGVITLSLLKDNFSIKEKLNEFQIQEYFLERDIPKEKECIRELENDAKPVENENKDEKIVKINNKVVFEKQKIYLKKLAIYGSKIKRYTKNYNNGSLDNNLREQLITDGINPDEFENYIEYKKELTKKVS